VFIRQSMNKKILSPVLLIAPVLMALILPFTVAADQLTTITTSIENAAWIIGTTVVVIGWIITGILFLIAQGAPEKLSTAKTALIAAVVGTLLIVLAGSAASLIRSAIGIT
jgi:hypothetical protein